MRIFVFTQLLAVLSGQRFLPLIWRGKVSEVGLNGCNLEAFFYNYSFFKPIFFLS